MSNTLHFDTIIISKEWFEIGEKKDGVTSEDVAFRFIAYWIAFNGLFASADGEEEHQQIKNYINQVYNSHLKGILDDKIMRMQEIEIFKSAPILKGEHKPSDKKNYRNPSNPFYPYEYFMDGKNEKDRLVGLLLMIKQIRNNMFHGTKTPYPERNFQLVDGAQKVLNVLLKQLI